MHRKQYQLLSLSLLLTLISCESIVGTDGIVVDQSTGERISGVIVKMTSNEGNETEVTNTKGYFNVTKFYNCGFSSCDSNYKIKFSKPGYEDKIINEDFDQSSEAEYTTPPHKDTLIIKLTGF